MARTKSKPLFSLKPPGLVLRKGLSRPPVARRMILSDREEKAKLEQAWTAQKKHVYTTIQENRGRRKRVYRRCLAISTVLNLAGFIGFFFWVIQPKQLPPKIAGDAVYVTLIRPSVLPEPSPRQRLPPPIEEPLPVEEPPEEVPEIQDRSPEPPEALPDAVSTEPENEPEPLPEDSEAVPESLNEPEPDAPVEPMEIETLVDSTQAPQTPDSISTPVELEGFKLSETNHVSPQAGLQELVEVSPFHPTPASVNGRAPNAAPLPLSTLQQRGANRETKPDRPQNALRLPNLQRGEGSSETHTPLASNTALDLQALEANKKTPKGRKPQSPNAAVGVSDFGDANRSKKPQSRLAKPTVELEALGEQKKVRPPFLVVPTASDTDLKPQQLPKLLRKITPKFPAAEGVKRCQVVLHLWVETDGTPGELRVHKVNTDPVSVDETTKQTFIQAAIDATKAARFQPARRDGKLVRLLIEVPIWFEMSKS